MSRRNRRATDMGPGMLAVLDLAAPPAPELVDARPAREHARRLVRDGWGTRGLASRAGLSRHTVQALLYGRTAADPPTRQVLPDTRDRILEIDPGEVPPCRQRPR